MRELNEMELDQVAGAGGFSYFKGTQADGSSIAAAGYGFATTKSVTNSVSIGPLHDSFAATSGLAVGYDPASASDANSSSGKTIVIG